MSRRSGKKFSSFVRDSNGKRISRRKLCFSFRELKQDWGEKIRKLKEFVQEVMVPPPTQGKGKGNSKVDEVCVLEEVASALMSCIFKNCYLR